MGIVGIWRQLLFPCKIWILFLFYALKLLKKGPHYSRSDIIPGEKFFNMVCNKPNFNQGKTLCRFYLATFLGKWNKTVEAKSDMFCFLIFWHFLNAIANYIYANIFHTEIFNNLNTHYCSWFLASACTWSGVGLVSVAKIG